MDKRSTAALAFLILGVCTPAAQQVIPLSKVRTIQVREEPGTKTYQAFRVREERSTKATEAALESAVISEIQRTGIFRIVVPGDHEVADARLFTKYGCDTFTGLPFSHSIEQTPDDLCETALFTTEPVPEKIWRMPTWRIRELQLDVVQDVGRSEDEWMALASRLVADLVAAWKLAREGRLQPEPVPVTLSRVKTLFISKGWYNFGDDCEDVSMENLLYQHLLSWRKATRGAKEKRKPEGSCATGGWISMLHDVKIVCFPAEADAILVSLHPVKYKGPVQFDAHTSSTTTINPDGGSTSTDAWTHGTIAQETYRVGGAFLVDRRSL